MITMFHSNSIRDKLKTFIQLEVNQMLKGILEFSHYLLQESVRNGDLVIDATCGNGHDTLFLSKLVGDHGNVLAFDIQLQAIKRTKARLVEHSRRNVEVIHDSHAKVEQYIVPDQLIGGAIFNLGYLPQSNKKVITYGDTTIAAVQTILDHLKIGGIIVLVVYHGHEGGKEEKQTLLKFVSKLEQKKFHVLRYGFINQKNDPPFIIAIEKRK